MENYICPFSVNVVVINEELFNNQFTNNSALKKYEIEI